MCAWSGKMQTHEFRGRATADTRLFICFGTFIYWQRLSYFYSQNLPNTLDS